MFKNLEIKLLGNHIRIDTAADLSEVVLTTHVNGRDLAWITFDAEQLDELIRLLVMIRADLLPPPLI